MPALGAGIFIWALAARKSPSVLPVIPGAGLLIPAQRVRGVTHLVGRRRLVFLLYAAAYPTKIALRADDFEWVAALEHFHCDMNAPRSQLR
jgi:hypothetical protein